MKPIIQLLFSPFLYIWYEVAWWSQIFIFLLFGFEDPAKAIVEEYEITSSQYDETEVYKEYNIDFGDDESNNDIFENYIPK